MSFAILAVKPFVPLTVVKLLRGEVPSDNFDNNLIEPSFFTSNLISAGFKMNNPSPKFFVELPSSSIIFSPTFTSFKM